MKQYDHLDLAMSPRGKSSTKSSMAMDLASPALAKKPKAAPDTGLKGCVSKVFAHFTNPHSKKPEMDLPMLMRCAKASQLLDAKLAESDISSIFAKVFGFAKLPVRPGYGILFSFRPKPVRTH